MAQAIPRSEFLADLQMRIGEHCDVVQRAFAPLDKVQANTPPAAGEWSPLQCFEHLNLTHEYYMDRMEPALAASRPADPSADVRRVY